MPGSSSAATTRRHCPWRARGGIEERTRSSKRTRPTASRWRSSNNASAGQSLGVLQLGETAVRARLRGTAKLGDARAAPVHRLADVQHDRRAEVGLFFILPHDPPVGARRDLPIDVARVVARLIGAILRELHRKSLPWGPVKP